MLRGLQHKNQMHVIWHYNIFIHAYRLIMLWNGADCIGNNLSRRTKVHKSGCILFMSCMDLPKIRFVFVRTNRDEVIPRCRIVIFR